jgi:hypothetical protein
VKLKRELVENRLTNLLRHLFSAVDWIRVESALMGDYSLITGKCLYRLTCECCGTEKNRVWGLVSKDKDVHVVYCALLNTTEDVPRVGLTLAVGPWCGGPESSKRMWVHTEVRAEGEKFQFVIRNPHESNFSPWEKSGTPLSPERARATQEIRELANFVVQTDVAITSYLAGGIVDPAGREQRDTDHTQRSC